MNRIGREYRYRVPITHWRSEAFSVLHRGLAVYAVNMPFDAMLEVTKHE